MSEEFKKCPNGHYYQGATCPYCKSDSSAPTGNATSMKTEMFGVAGGPGMPPPPPPAGGATQGFDGGGANQTATYGSGGTKTTVLDTQAGPGNVSSNRTVFGDFDEAEAAANPADKQERVYRETRKLVGWLVTYSLDPMGIDFKLYEGRNIIGRDMGCNVTVNDNMISSQHAVILYRSGKYSIKDQQSSHGTFVNDEDIELEPRYLNDGDSIRMGQTIFKFRSSL